MIEERKLKDGNRVRIYQDEDAESPRELDNVGEMICFHPNYELGDKHDYNSPDEIELKEGDIVLPLWLYDHSGISMSCGERTYPYDCQWDSGQVGVIIARAEKIKEENLSDEQVRKILKSEVEVYDLFIRGQVYGYLIEKPVTCECCDNTEWEHVDSCCGFIGYEHLESELKAILGEEFEL